MFTAMIGSSLAIAAGTFLPQPSLAKEGYLPDMTGGLKIPKGLGGLPKKIRSVSNIMVSNALLEMLSSYVRRECEYEYE